MAGPLDNYLPVPLTEYSNELRPLAILRAFHSRLEEYHWSMDLGVTPEIMQPVVDAMNVCLAGVARKLKFDPDKYQTTEKWEQICDLKYDMNFMVESYELMDPVEAQKLADALLVFAAAMKPVPQPESSCVIL